MQETINWMRSCLIDAQQASGPDADSRLFQIANMPIEFIFNDSDLANAYCNKLLLKTSIRSPIGRIFVSIGKQKFIDVPKCQMSTFSVNAFYKACQECEIDAIYPENKGYWQFFDRKSRTAVVLIRNHTDLPRWDISAPLRLPLQWLLGQERMRMTHAAVVGIENKGVIVFGKGGSGKSGTTLAALAAGMSTVGDDYVALGFGASPFARPLYNHVKQDRRGLDLIPELSSKLRKEPLNWRGKIEFNPAVYFLDCFVEEMELHAVILPRIDNYRWPSIISAPSSECMLALISSNLHIDAASHDAGLGIFAGLVRSLPCYKICLSKQSLENGRVLKEFVANL